MGTCRCRGKTRVYPPEPRRPAKEPRTAFYALARAMDLLVSQVEAIAGAGAAGVAAASGGGDAEEAPPTLPAVHGTVRFLAQSLGVGEEGAGGAQ